MVGKKNITKQQFHRSQIARAKRYIRMNFSMDISSDDIARESGASPFHFARIFLAYTGLTPFDFLRNIRLARGLHLLRSDAHHAITDIALSVGYDSSSAFNKVFKKTFHISPSEFRKLGQVSQAKIIHDLEHSQFAMEFAMTLNMELVPEIVIRRGMHYLYVEKSSGPFPEIAPPAWGEMLETLGAIVHKGEIIEYLGLSTIDRSNKDKETAIYQAGVAFMNEPTPKPKGLQYKQLEKGRYAKFLLRGAYTQLWPAFSKVFRSLSESNIPLREGFCIENYLNDPRITPEDALITELLVPIE